MTLSRSQRRKVGLFGTLLTGILLLTSGQALGLTAAGQVITNEATVSYEDALGNPFSASSNEARVTVAEVYAATLEQDRSRTGAPGQTVYFQHFLENTGNATDTYTITTFRDDDQDGASDTAGDDSDYFVYLDSNGNGEPNAGEPVVLNPANASATLSLAAGDRANLLVGFPIPGGAANNATFGATIEVTSANATVDDLTSGDGLDSLEGTNNDSVTVSTGPVLNLVKNATFEDNGTPNDLSDDSILYTLQVTNNGGSAATNVDIVDVIPADTTFDAVVSISGLLAANDLQMTGLDGSDDPILQAIGTGTAAAFAIDEAALGLDALGAAEDLDINVDGDAADTDVTAIFFRDASLPPNVTVSVQYRVDIDTGLPAGQSIDNVFIADDTDSPVVTVTVPQAFAVDATDTGENNGNDGVNNGEDDDGDNDVQFVNRVADGSTVLFNNIINNNGNGSDVLELSIANDGGDGTVGSCSAFPAGTSFQFFNAANTATLSNTNGQFGIDTGVLPAGGSLNITVRANLPAGFSGDDFCATLTARSFGAGTTNPVADTKIEHVGEIVAPTLDLANTFAAVGLNDAGVADADDASAVTTTATVAAGAVQDFELFVANEGVAADSYNLSAANVPAGWSVSFIQRGIHTDGDGNLDNIAGAGAVVTTTPLIPAGAVYQYTARVTTSAVPAQSLANAPGSDDPNSDGDNDYVLTFAATSTTNPASVDTKLDAIDIADDPAVEVNPDNQDQVQPGGSVDYANTITNTGNTTLLLTLTKTHSIAGFDSAILIDTDGDGTPDTELGNLTAGTITVDNGSGTDQDIEVTISGTDPVLQLEPGEVIPLAVTVQAPANAAQGDEDFLEISAVDPAASDTATDRTEVVTVQVRLEKTVAVDTGCGCDPDPLTLTFPAVSGSGATLASTDVEPDQCVVWLLTATNQSTQDALNVTINDSVTAFTTLEQPDPGTDDGLYYQGPADAALGLVSADSDTDEATVTGSDVIFDVGTLAGGESASGTFCVRVE